jgi:hypothetical protein
MRKEPDAVDAGSGLSGLVPRGAASLAQRMKEKRLKQTCTSTDRRGDGTGVRGRMRLRKSLKKVEDRQTDRKAETDKTRRCRA